MPPQARASAAEGKAPPQNASPVTPPNAEKHDEGRSDPGLGKSEEVFRRFFHFARRF
jgi:hypothetical protein